MSIVSAVDFSALGEYEMVYPNLNTRRLVREGILFLLKFVLEIFSYHKLKLVDENLFKDICKRICMPLT